MIEPPVIHSLSRDGLRDLQHAKALLENPGLTIRLANLLGSPLERGFALLPKGWTNKVNDATRAALMNASKLAVASLGRQRRRGSRDLFHKFAVGASGTIGGVFGLAALPAELPISTAIMLRSIADIARSEGHDISSMQTRLECLEVFALGSPASGASATESSYWLTRAALSRSLTEAISFLTEKGTVDLAAPVIARLINSIATRFGFLVSEEVAAKALPVIGAAGGGLINVLFIAHFQDMARGHFIMKRLEKVHGIEMVKQLYAEVKV